MNLLVNIDVDDLEKATRFYCDGLGLTVGRRFDGWTELDRRGGADLPVAQGGGNADLAGGERQSATTGATGRRCISISSCTTSAPR